MCRRACRKTHRTVDEFAPTCANTPADLVLPRARFPFGENRERFEIFGDFNPDGYAEEAEQRWGATEVYEESTRRTSRYPNAEWQRWKAEQQDWGQRLATAIDAGIAAGSPEAVELAEEHRQGISRWFYECSYEIHTGLADMYVNDERFTAHYERLKPGMANYLHDAIHANAAARS